MSDYVKDQLALLATGLVVAALTWWVASSLGEYYPTVMYTLSFCVLLWRNHDLRKENRQLKARLNTGFSESPEP
ncbi:hypothetical protein [Pseudomonas sp. RIT-PI-AD]|uniref:hypothetical protein n=1 Tax=Pseudomonas sp. RIT-PI-AD TaxID=3035294 RepID=UPI0021DB5906|nr:hypothetical protein [Pseudomonas sp. RIT-PI-AD]